MADEDGPVIAEHFYRKFFQNDPIDSTQAAYALHEAVKQLRAQGVSPARWATFIHIGV
jgi:hypothetical protein